MKKRNAGLLVGGFILSSTFAWAANLECKIEGTKIPNGATTVYVHDLSLLRNEIFEAKLEDCPYTLSVGVARKATAGAYGILDMSLKTHAENSPQISASFKVPSESESLNEANLQLTEADGTKTQLHCQIR